MYNLTKEELENGLLYLEMSSHDGYTITKKAIRRSILEKIAEVRTDEQ
jgi:hypothetical protein